MKTSMIEYPKVEKGEKTLKHIKVGVIGCGYWGPKLARNFNDLPESDLMMVSDLREDRLQEINKLYPSVILMPLLSPLRLTPTTLWQKKLYHPGNMS